jgi:hypothetical protein
MFVSSDFRACFTDVYGYLSDKRLSNTSARKHLVTKFQDTRTYNQSTHMPILAGKDNIVFVVNVTLKREFVIILVHIYRTGWSIKFVEFYGTVFITRCTDFRNCFPDIIYISTCPPWLYYKQFSNYVKSLYYSLPLRVKGFIRLEIWQNI